MARWARLDAMVGREVNETFGEPVTITPRRTVPKRGAVQDPDRAPGTIVGVLSVSPGERQIDGSRRGTEVTGHTTFAVSQARVWVSAANVALLGYRPARDDAVSLPDRGGASYVVVRVDATDVGDVVLHLVPESQQ